MQQQGISRRKALFILIAGLIAFILLVTVVFLLTQKNENQFGKFIKIQNYDTKVKNLSSDMRDSMESYLYNIVVKNLEDETKASRVGDAMIREGSDSQEYTQQTQVYNGTFIVDMQSIKQSYNVQYVYSTNDTKLVEGNTVVISCLPADQLIYGDFNCTDFVSEQSGDTDVLMQYLPFQNFTFSITPDATQGEKLVLIVELDIPEIDLSGSAQSRAETVKLYKGEVVDWIKSKGANPADYTIQYNYDNSGNLIKSDDDVQRGV